MLLSKCAYVINRNGETEVLSQSDRSKIEAVKDRWSAKGKRVILMAQKPLSSDAVNATCDEKAVLESAVDGLTLVGLVGLIDPPVGWPYLSSELQANGYRETKFLLWLARSVGLLFVL
jgi:sodium/potassium-transporting ATPase subunit alpha